MGERKTLNLSGSEVDALCRLLWAYLGSESADPREAELRAIAGKLGYGPDQLPEIGP